MSPGGEQSAGEGKVFISLCVQERSGPLGSGDPRRAVVLSGDVLSGPSAPGRGRAPP